MMGPRRATSLPRLPRRGPASFLGGLLAVGILGGCASLLHVPAVDLSAPGWTVWTGQALWTRSTDTPAIAGEVIIARRGDGEVMVSLSKPPVPIFTARRAGDVWRIDLVEGGHAYAGCGKPPKRFVWFWLPEIIGGGAPPGRWTATHPEKDTWLLANPRSGERVRLVLDP